MIPLREYIPFYRRNLKVALPVMLTHIGASLVGFVDTMMVGHFSTTALAAVSLSNAIGFTDWTKDAPACFLSFASKCLITH